MIISKLRRRVSSTVLLFYADGVVKTPCDRIGIYSNGQTSDGTVLYLGIGKGMNSGIGLSYIVVPLPINIDVFTG